MSEKLKAAVDRAEMALHENAIGHGVEFIDIADTDLRTILAALPGELAASRAPTEAIETPREVADAFSLGAAVEAIEPGEAEVSPSAYLKHWWDGGTPRCRVDLSEINEPWLQDRDPTVTPLYPLAALRTTTPASDESGYAFFNEDTGMEWSRNHPIESGEVPDATEVDTMTLGQFREKFPAPASVAVDEDAEWLREFVNTPWLYVVDRERLRTIADRLQSLLASIRVKDEADGWRDIETAPHATDVLLFIPPALPATEPRMEVGYASNGEVIDGISNRWWHGLATHWRPLPKPPAALKAIQSGDGE